jgi:mono/diheme cytochrome c family protein
MSMGQRISCRHSAKTLIAMKGITDGEIYWVVTNGITKSGMPAFKTKANDQERWLMTLYVKRMMSEHPHAGH